MSIPEWKPGYSNPEHRRAGYPEQGLSEDYGPGFPEEDAAHVHGTTVGSKKSPSFAPDKYLNRMAVKAGDRIVLVSMNDILWIQSYGNLIRLHLENASYDHQTTIKDAYTLLDPEHFLRVHRNAIVNLNYVTEFDLPRCGNAFVHLRNGKALPISQSARQVLRRGLLSQSYATTNID